MSFSIELDLVWLENLVRCPLWAVSMLPTGVFVIGKMCVNLFAIITIIFSSQTVLSYYGVVSKDYREIIVK